MNVYILKNIEDTEVGRFFLDKNGEIKVVLDKKGNIDALKAEIEKIFQTGVFARRADKVVAPDGKESYATIFIGIEKKDRFYEDAVVEQIKRAGYKVEKAILGDLANKLLQQASGLKLPVNTKKDLLEKISLAGNKDLKALEKMLRM